MTAVTRLALERLNASSITSSSIRFSLTGGPVGCTTKASAPRTLSWIWNQTSPSEKGARWARPRGTLSERAIASPRVGWAVPVNTLSSRDIRFHAATSRHRSLHHHAPYWLGRKDSNLRIRGSKPRALTAWLRPNRRLPVRLRRGLSARFASPALAVRLPRPASRLRPDPRAAAGLLAPRPPPHPLRGTVEPPSPRRPP